MILLRRLTIFLAGWVILSPSSATLTEPIEHLRRGPAVALSSSLGPVRAFPNPWRADQHSGATFITFDRLTENTTIKIFTISAEHVATLNTASDTSVRWDLTNQSGAGVASGIYLYLASNDSGGKASGKLAVIR